MSKKEVLTFVFLVCLAVSCFVFAATSDPWDGTTWDVTAPDIDQPMGNSYKEIYDLRKGVAIRVNKEHETLAASSAGGVHKQGSARAFFQDAAPTTQVDTSAFDSGDLGSLWFDSNSTIDNELAVLTATTPTWTPVSTNIIATLLASNRTFAGTLTVTGESTFNNHVNLGAGDDLIGSSTSDIAFNTNKFTVAGDTGNTVIAGTASVGGTLTITGATAANGSITLGAGDDLIGSSTSDITINTNKFTVAGDTGNTVIAGTLSVAGATTIFGSWTDKDSGGSNALAKTEVYKVGSDGFLLVYDTSTGGEAATAMTVKTDGNSSPATVRAQYMDTDGNTLGTLTVPIKKDDYWQVTWANTCTIYWLPIGSGTCVKQ